MEIYIARDEKELGREKLDLVGISSVTYNFYEAIRLAKISVEQLLARDIDRLGIKSTSRHLLERLRRKLKA